ncbi:dihydrolipoyl dehydrogenase [Desulfovibrio litoralis]|uniref:Dihydrolipoyl dehydrogenase n=1 Tax=Desulfovibrio litoralis DSM 11393 TaxID=1121455 RepID=A0A1M7SQH3_9BACT|nr:dihydrolipoyl dehydrogenase [Desulfovibrio litoralis]SHN60689.1 dihydrolipoamide dehydrogenase [Desulfovibrio litoralis DSM 11393]
MLRITIIGGGPGGYTAAFAAAKRGASVTLIEAESLGGTCLNWGCIPTKTIKTSADAILLGKRFESLGLEQPTNFSINMKTVVNRKDSVINILRSGLEKKCSALKIKLIAGKASLLNENTVEVKLNDNTNTKIESDFIIIATGSRNLELKNFAFDQKNILSSDDMLNLESVPKRLCIVGGGVIGCEMAFIYAAFGSKVTIIEAQDRLLPLASVDLELSKLLQREAKKSGINVIVKQSVQSYEQNENGLKVTIKAIDNDNTTELESDTVLISVGRIPQTQGLNLEQVGVSTDERGWIKVNDYLESSIKNIYAIGDVLGPTKIMLAHVAAAEGLCVIKNIFGETEKMDYSVVPSAIFTMPEIGTVGITEQEAKAKGLEVKTTSVLMRELGKAHALGELPGLVKLVAETKTGRLLGANISGAYATELIAELTLALKMRASVKDIAQTIHAHPTLSEGIFEAALSLSEEI